MSASSHAKLFVDLNAFGLSAHLASVCSDCHELQTVKRSWFFLSPLLQDVLSPFFFFSKMVAQKMTSHIQVSEKEEKKTKQGPSSGEAEKFQLFPD